MADPYELAKETETHIEGNLSCLLPYGFLGTNTDVEKVRLLNYLRTVRTHIELLEHSIIHPEAQHG